MNNEENINKLNATQINKLEKGQCPMCGTDLGPAMDNGSNREDKVLECRNCNFRDFLYKAQDRLEHGRCPICEAKLVDGKNPAGFVTQKACPRCSFVHRVN